MLFAASSAGPTHAGGAASPPTNSSCAARAGVLAPIHLTVVRGGRGPAVLVRVCVDGHGPYPFVLDTGASVSLVDSRLVTQLHLPAATPSQEVVGLGCVATSKRVRLSSWSAGGLVLAPQTVMTAHIAGFGSSASPVGILGSDVLARFGADLVDFKAKRLVVLGPEAPPRSQASVVRGGILDAPPRALISGVPKAAVSLTIVEFNGSALATTPVVFGGHGSSPNPFVISTGSSRSSVSAGLAKLLSLQPAGPKVKSSAVGCTQSARAVASGPWNVGSSVPVAPSSLVAFTPSVATESGVLGTVGADVLSRYGSIVLDYRSGILWLGTG